MIIRRRDKVVARYFRLLNPLADFRLASGAAGPEIAFTNYGEDVGLGTVEAYEYEWFRFNNASGAHESLGPAARAPGRAIPLLAARPEYLMVRIRSIAAGADAWKKAVDVFLRTTGELRIVGIERETP